MRAATFQTDSCVETWVAITTVYVNQGYKDIL